MNGRVLLVSALLLLFLVGCGKVAAPPAKPTVTTQTPEPSTPTGTGTAPEPAVKEVDYESIFKLQYCNYTIANLDYDVARAREEQEDAEQALAKAQDELAKETDSGTRAGIQETIEEYKTTIEDMKKEATVKQAKLADTISKCSTLEKKKDSAICKVFIADAKAQLDSATATLAGEQEDLNQAVTNNVQSKILKNQRKVAKAQATVNKMQAIADELQTRCK